MHNAHAYSDADKVGKAEGITVVLMYNEAKSRWSHQAKRPRNGSKNRKTYFITRLKCLLYTAQTHRHLNVRVGSVAFCSVPQII